MENEQADACLCFDANLPKMCRCTRNCDKDKQILCPHRFNFNAEIIYCNGKKFEGWQDARILNYFLNHLRRGIKNGSINPGSIFIILTKDSDFLKDAELEWRMHGDPGENPRFYINRVEFGDIRIGVETINCRNYGDTGRDNLECVIHKMNKLFRQDL